MQNITLKNDLYNIEMQRLTFGPGGFDDLGKQEEYFSLLDAYYEHFGGRSIDTARLYGNGVTEKVIGSWLKSRGIRRDEIVITTKGGHPPLTDMRSHRLDRESLESDLSESLSALGLNYVDVYLLHRDCAELPVGGIMDILDDFVKSGRVRIIGVSNWRAERIAEANRYAVKAGKTPLSVSQINFSLAKTTPERLGDKTLVAMNECEYRWYRENNFPVMAFSAQAKGFFAKLAAGEAATPKIVRRFMTDGNLARLERVKEVSKQLGILPAAAALAYLASNPLPTSAVFSCRTLEQLADSMSARNVVLPAETVRYLETGE